MTWVLWIKVLMNVLKESENKNQSYKSKNSMVIWTGSINNQITGFCKLCERKKKKSQNTNTLK